MIGGNPLEDHDADGLVNQGTATGRLAWMRTDATADSRDRHAIADGSEGLIVAIILDFLNIGRDVNMRRAAIHAGRRQLVVIALGLFPLALTTQKGQVVFTEIFNRIENRSGRCHAECAFAVVEQVAQPGQGVQITLFAVSGKNSRQGVHHDPRPTFTGGALRTTVLLLDTLHILSGHGDNIDIFVQDDNTVPAHEGAYVAFVKIVARQLKGSSFRLTTLPIVDHLTAPAGKNDFSQVEPPISVSFSAHKKTAKKRLGAFQVVV